MGQAPVTTRAPSLRAPAGGHEFQRLGDGRYQLVVPELNTDFEVNQVRRERLQLHAEVTVYCGLAGVKTHNRELFMAGLNLSALRDRDQLVRSLAISTKIAADTWAPVVHELSTRVRQAEDIGAGIVNLRDVARPPPPSNSSPSAGF